MVYSVNDIIRDVRTCIDQNTISEQLISLQDIDTLSLNEIIKSKIVQGIEIIEKDAPMYLLEEGHNLKGQIYWGDKESGYFYLPSDYMRLIIFRMSDWERPVYSPITAASPEYQLQKQRVKALRGNCQRPICAVINRPEGKVLEFYSCKNEKAQIAEAMYLPYPKIDSFGGVDICKHCYNSIIYTIASLVLITINEIDKSKVFVELAKTALK